MESEVVVTGEEESTNGNSSSQQVTHQGVLVTRIPDGNGNERIELMDLNGIDPLSVPTLLRLAANVRQQGLGL